jgi:hypothetical protein
MTSHLRWDGLSGWQIAPRVAWEAGEGCLVRAFDIAESALDFLAQHLGKAIANAERQRRHRQRRRRRTVALRMDVPEDVIALLVSSGRLPAKDVDDHRKVGTAICAAVKELGKRWREEHFS